MKSPVHTADGRECSRCHEFKPWSEFTKLVNGFNGHRAACRSCTAGHVLPLVGVDHPCADAECGTLIAWNLKVCGPKCSNRLWKRKHQVQRRCTQCGTEVGKAMRTCTECKLENQRASHRRRRFGLSRSAFAELLSSQNDRCAICRSSEPGGPYGSWQVDHCHDSGLVRGLLCVKCNIGIGHLNDDPELVDRAAAYLRQDRHSLRIVG